MKETYYFLFGEEISKLYHEANFNEVVALARKGGDIAIASFTPKMDHPSDLLSEYDGWMGFAEIDESEYLQLLEILPK